MSGRLVSIALLLVAVFACSRALVRALPGDPIETLIAETGTTIAPAELRENLGLDRPFLFSVATDLRKAAHGDFGRSIFSGKPVFSVVIERAAKSLELALVTVLLSLLISLPLGLLAASGRLGRVCSAYGALMAALPTPWIGPVLIYVFALKVRIFPLGGSVWLPAISLALGVSALWSRLIRSRVKDTLTRGSAPGARARGIPEWKVLLKYGLAPASGALISFFGTQVGWLMGGAMVAEVIFAWPGMGELLVQSVLRRDYPLVECATFFGAAFCLVGGALGDGLRALLDPRSRLELKL